MKLSNLEQKHLRKFLVKVYGSQAKTWTMDEGMFKLTFKMLQKSKKCSDLVDLVPRPMAPGKGPLKYISRQVRKIILRKLKDRKGYYAMCVKSPAYRMRKKFIEESLGL
jgi:hypothetical protein